jgi:acyl carrier protein
MSSAKKDLNKILSDILLLKESEINEAISRKDVDTWDSLAHLMLINEVEATFEVTFTDDDIVEINTVGDLEQKLRKLGVDI